MSELNGSAPSIVCLGTLARAEALASAQITHRLREHDLSRTAFNALTFLAQAESPLGPQALAQLLLVSPGAVTQLLDLLERQGRIRRQSSKSDRRMSVVTLTATGKRVLAEAEPAVAQANDRALAGLSLNEQRQLMRLLQKLEKHVQALSE